MNTTKNKSTYWTVYINEQCTEMKRAQMPSSELVFTQNCTYTEASLKIKIAISHFW